MITPFTTICQRLFNIGSSFKARFGMSPPNRASTARSDCSLTIFECKAGASAAPIMLWPDGEGLQDRQSRQSTPADAIHRCQPAQPLSVVTEEFEPRIIASSGLQFALSISLSNSLD